jgi:hypothetical protein
MVGTAFQSSLKFVSHGLAPVSKAQEAAFPASYRNQVSGSQRKSGTPLIV